MKPNYDANCKWAEKTQKALQSKPRKRGKRLPKVSAKQKVKNEEYNALKPAFFEENPNCKRCADKGLERPANDPHHTGGRTGKRLADFSKIIALCRQCHDWVHANPREAMKAGYKISSHVASTQE